MRGLQRGEVEVEVEAEAEVEVEVEVFSRTIGNVDA